MLDAKIECVSVKGIKDFIDDKQSSSEKWEEVACLMAASVVAKILSDPVMFQDWPHFNAGIASYLNLSFIFIGIDLILICLHVNMYISQIKMTHMHHISLKKHPCFSKHHP